MQSPVEVYENDRIEAAQMIHKGQVFGMTRANLARQAWAFGALLGLR
jgi:hypothetical protein